jgi:preprotein translocase subunit SecE
LKVKQVAKVGVGEFANQVKAEAKKIVWPTRQETLWTAFMVVIMTTLLGVFFFAVDSGFNALVRGLLALLS